MQKVISGRVVRAIIATIVVMFACLFLVPSLASSQEKRPHHTLQEQLVWALQVQKNQHSLTKYVCLTRSKECASAQKKDRENTKTVRQTCQALRKGTPAEKTFADNNGCWKT